MKNRPRGGLGRGLGALIPTAPAVDPSSPVAPSPAPIPPPSPPSFDGVSVPDAAPTSGLAPVPGARFADLPVTAITPT